MGEHVVGYLRGSIVPVCSRCKYRPIYINNKGMPSEYCWECLETEEDPREYPKEHPFRDK